ncbi:hypothetical protein PO909_022050 [Leuciscus waleckii]
MSIKEGFYKIAGFNVGNAIGDGGEDSRGDGFGGHVELGIIGVAVKMESMVADDLTEGKHVDGEEEGAEHGTLGDTMGDRGGVGVAVVNRDKVVTVREVGDCIRRWPLNIPRRKRRRKRGNRGGYLVKLKARLRAGSLLDPINESGGSAIWRPLDLIYQWLRPVLPLHLSPVSHAGLHRIGLGSRR